MSAFEIDFECGNCGNEWNREFEPGIVVQKSTQIGKSGIGVYESSQYGKNNHKEDISCPVCETCYRVSVADRTPLIE